VFGGDALSVAVTSKEKLLAEISRTPSSLSTSCSSSSSSSSATICPTVTVTTATPYADFDTQDFLIIVASLVQICGEDNEGLFTVQFSETVVSGVASLTATLNGITVTDGQIVALELDDDDEQEVDFEDGVLEISASSFSLDVTATDNASPPNTATGSLSPSFNNLGECDDDDNGDDNDDDD